MLYIRAPSFGALFFLLIISFSSCSHIIAQASLDAATCNNAAAARILYLRQPHWTDYSQLITAVDTTHPITSLHIIDTNTCKKSKLCSTGSLAVLGDASGRLLIISPSVGILLEISNKNSTVEVTALTSFASEHSSIVVIAGYSDGTLLWHTLYSGEQQVEEAQHARKNDEKRKEIDLSSLFSVSSQSGVLSSETATSPWTVLDAFPLHGGKHGFVNIAGATANGHIAWGRIYLGTKKKWTNYNTTNELHYDSLLTVGNSTITIAEEVLKEKEERIVAVKAHLKAAEYITSRGEVIWSPFFKKRKQQKQGGGHVLRPPRPCDGWDKHIGIPLQHIDTSNSESNCSSVVGNENSSSTGWPFSSRFSSAVAIETPSSPSSRIFVALNDGCGSSSSSSTGELASLRTGTASGRPSCTVISRVAPQPQSSNRLSTKDEDNGDNLNINNIEKMVALPGYVVALTSTGELQVYNTSGAFHRPSFSTVLQHSLEDLITEITDNINTNGGRRNIKSSSNSKSVFWQSWSPFWNKKKDGSKHQFPLKNERNTKNQWHYRIAAGASTPFPSATSAFHYTSPSSALVAIQLRPTLIGLYATSFPYTPPRGVAGGPNSKNRINWLAALQPLLVAVAVGFAMHKAKVGKRQAAAQQFFRSRMMERAAAAGGGGGFSGGGRGGGIDSFRNIGGGGAGEKDDWNEPFPWEQRVNGRSSNILRGGAAPSTGGEQTRKDYRRKFKIDTGLGGRRAHNTATSTNTSGRTNSRTSITHSTILSEERYISTRPAVPSSQAVPPPLIDRAPLPLGEYNQGGRGEIEAVLDDLGSEDYSSSSEGYKI